MTETAPVGPDDELAARLKTRWLRLCADLGSRRLERAGPLFDRLAVLYRTPPREYHTLAHVAECLSIFDEVGAEAEHAPELEFAIFLHDSVYDARAADNEAQSAAAAVQMLADLAAEADAARIESLILATRHDGSASASDERLIVDIDLSILGRDEPTYDAFAAAIRREYAFASDQAFTTGRSNFLRSMLARDQLFHHPSLRAKFEAQARRNLKRELERLAT